MIGLTVLAVTLLLSALRLCVVGFFFHITFWPMWIKTLSWWLSRSSVLRKASNAHCFRHVCYLAGCAFILYLLLLSSLTGLCGCLKLFLLPISILYISLCELHWTSLAFFTYHICKLSIFIKPVALWSVLIIFALICVLGLMGFRNECFAVGGRKWKDENEEAGRAKQEHRFDTLTLKPRQNKSFLDQRSFSEWLTSTFRFGDGECNLYFIIVVCYITTIIIIIFVRVSWRIYNVF